MTSKQRDLLSAVFFILIAVLLLAVAIPLGVVEPKKVKFAALNPSYYPKIVSYCLLAFGLLLLVTRVFLGSKTNTTDDTKSSDNHINVIRLLWIACILALYYLSLPLLGFVLSSIIVLAALLITAGEKSIVALLGISIVLPFALYYFFVKVANIPIPSGVLEPFLVGS